MYWKDIIYLSCKQATYYSSIKQFKRLSAFRKFQLKLHNKICPDCLLFEEQSELIDMTLEKLHNYVPIDLEQKFSQEKKDAIQHAIEKQLQ